MASQDQRLQCIRNRYYVYVIDLPKPSYWRQLLGRHHATLVAS